MKGLAFFFVLVALLFAALMAFDFWTLSDNEQHVFRNGKMIRTDILPSGNSPSAPAPAETNQPR